MREKAKESYTEVEEKGNSRQRTARARDAKRQTERNVLYRKKGNSKTK